MKLRTKFYSAMATCIAALVLSPTVQALTYSQEVLNDNPLVYYQFNEVAGTTANNSGSQGAASNGTFTGAHNLNQASAFGTLGSSLGLNGGFVDLPAFGSHSQVTLEAWININGVAAGCCTSIYSTDSFGGGNIHFNVKSGRDVEHAVAGGGPNNQNTPGGVIQNGDWNHVVSTYDSTAGGAVKIFVNGVKLEDDAHANAPLGNLSVAQLGAFNGGRQLQGFVDEFAVYNTVLSEDRVIDHFIAGSGADDPRLQPSGSLISYHAFEGNLNDTSGNGLNHAGSLVGNATIVGAIAGAGTGTQAASFDGTNDRVDFANDADININTGNAFTFTSWIQANAQGGNRIIMAKAPVDFTGGGGGTHTGALFIDGSGALRWDNFFVNQVNTGGVKVDDGQFHHVGVTYDGATYSLFVDGALITTKAFAGGNEGIAPSQAWQYTLGESLNSTFPGGDFNGIIDEAAFWSVALNLAQIQDVFRNGVNTGNVPEPTTAILGLMGVAGMLVRRRRTT